MPWTKADVDSHKKGLSDSKKKAWVSIANGTLSACTKAGGKDCEGKAIRIANAMAPRTGESEILIPLNIVESEEELNLVLEVLKERPQPGKWKVNDVDEYVDDLSDAQKKVWVKVANSIYIHCKKSIGENCWTKAVDTATAIAPLIKENVEEIETIEKYKWVVEIMNKEKKEIKESTGEEVEFSDIIEAFGEIKVVKEDNVIKNVCIITRESKNNRVYKDEAMDDIVRLAEGVKSFADHPTKGMVRSVKALIGQFENARRVDGKGFADLKVLSSNKDWLLPIAKELPNIAGMSILAKGKISSEKDDKGREIVESVTELRSVDLVSEPATTKSLFEYKEPDDGSKNKKEEKVMEKITKEQWDAITVKDIQDNRADIYDKVKNSEELKTAKKELDEFKVKDAYRTKKELVDKLVLESELPKEAITELWKETLMQVEDKVVDDERVTIKEQVKKLIADRLAVVKSGTITGSGDEKKIGEDKEISDEEVVEIVKGEE